MTDLAQDGELTAADDLPVARPGSDPQSRDLPLDAHLHTEHSHDSEVPIDVYAAAAVERGIAELAITDHLDFGPGWPSTAAEFSRRERYVREAAERWADRGVAIRFGAEITYERPREAEIREHLARCSYDFTIGSVHVDADSPYDGRRVAAWVAGKSLPEIVEPYFAEVIAATRSGLFDTIGHLDVIKRYLHPHVLPADLAAAPELFAPVLAEIVRAGVALEVNASGLRQVPRETYPAPWAVALFRELGGRSVTAGSDAHRPEWFTWGLETAYEAAIDAGFRSLAFRRGRAADPVRIGIPERLLTGARSTRVPSSARALA